MVAPFGKYAADRLVRPPKGALPLQPTFKTALVRIGLVARALSFAETEALLTQEGDWWVRMRSLRALAPDTFGPPSYAHLINRILRMPYGDGANVGAARMLLHKSALVRPYGNVAENAKRTLKVAGVIRTKGHAPSLINEIVSYIFKRAMTPYRWDTFFGKHHRQAEVMMIFLKRNRETNIDAFLVQLDSFFDLLTAEIWSRLKPGKNYPSFGHAIKDTTLNGALPQLMAALLLLHDLRLQSTTAHPRQKAGTPTRRLKHRDFHRMRPILIAALNEFQMVILP
jgi:hypothetical protein